MIISWFTQPPKAPGKFASYYQYDTITKEFSRIRLELGRTGADSGTFVSYRSGRTVGFSATPLKFSNETPGQVWSVNDSGDLCYKGKALPGPPPKPRDNVYDTSDPESSVHAGNPVCTDPPILPPGIKPGHLALLANDALATGKTTRLTAGNVLDGDLAAAIGDLAAAIKGQVSRIVGKPFDEITDEMILATLQGQAKIISGAVARDAQSGLDQALKAARGAYGEINDLIEAQGLVPNPDFVSSFKTLQDALTAAESASSGGNVRLAMPAIVKASKAVTAALKNIDAVEDAATKTQLDKASQSLGEADDHADDWAAVEMSYGPLTKAGSVDDYMKTMSTGEEA